MSRIIIETRSRIMIGVDTSEDTCLKFGFKHGDRISIVDTKKTGVVKGVGPSSPGSSIIGIWILFDGEKRCAFCTRETKLHII